MNHFNIILFLAFFIVGVASVNALFYYDIVQSAEAQNQTCKKCKVITDKASYERVDFDFYFLAASDKFENQMKDIAKLEKNKYQIKFDAIPISINVHDVKPNGDLIMRVYGGVTFEDPRDAIKYFKELDKLDFNLKDAVLYAKIYHLENTNHYINPQPDKVISITEIGNLTNIQPPIEIIEAVIIENQTS